MPPLRPRLLRPRSRRYGPMNGLLKSFTLVLFLALCATTTVFAQPSDAPSPAAAPMQLPPGMTPAIMKMMMTPGVAHPPGLPKDLVPVAGCIPAMGYHYVNQKNWPMGPIYGYYNGKPVF